jgi:alpha-tubulin suppressor-like RCC1 family protein
MGIWCWGHNQASQLGIVSTGGGDERIEPALVPGTAGWTAVDANGAFSCGLDGSGNVLCWGSDAQNQLGNGGGTGADVAAPMPVLAVPPGSRALATGRFHACAIGEDRTLWCWGLESDGQLGLGGMGLGRTQGTPMLLGPRTYARFTGGGRHSCAIGDAMGELWCWGANDVGQLGLGVGAGATPYPTPTRVGTGTGWLEVSAGSEHTCAIDATRMVYCHGEGANGRLGTGGAIDAPMPTPITRGGEWAMVSAGGLHTCAVDAGGALYCWGHNGSGQLGIATRGDHDEPRRACIPAP